LDPSADQERVLTSKVGIDATRPFEKPREKFERARIPVDNDLEKLARKLGGK
jgi:3-polyprenyl-4-hydroxybenzoate decarboxylase